MANKADLTAEMKQAIKSDLMSAISEIVVECENEDRVTLALEAYTRGVTDTLHRLTAENRKRHLEMIAKNDCAGEA